ncbi:hypothetical protein [Alteraurantiacibacter aquimixticola]|uniref:Uncharacterized protein n=1 Tax=Alteraurantiacibacter aquimixticola TaxID=2489173 RepID=A0A4T3EWI3_9SPHN|nr:hypothetical protein [Alteraurantiacibacter aquimixticola]TIX48906.1 hypothetical protein E5222_14295 [Alteraurantiacibacter aquimixticola]
MSGKEEFEPVRGPRFDILQDGEGEWLVARGQNGWVVKLFVIPFLALWLTGWSFGGIAAINALFNSEKFQLFLLVWLVGWVIGLAFALSWLGWLLAGKMRLAVRHGGLEFRWAMPLLSGIRRYNVREMRNLRPAGSMFGMHIPSLQPSAPPFFPFQQGGIRFSYGGRSVTVMHGLDEAEAEIAIAWLKQRLPSAESR